MQRTFWPVLTMLKESLRLRLRLGFEVRVKIWYLVGMVKVRIRD